MHGKLRSDEQSQGTGFGRWLLHLEDGIYLGVAVVLAIAAIAVLFSVAMDFTQLVGEDMHLTVLQMLDSLLLVLMLVEILHTVGISLREHVLISESFLTVGLIAAIRRVLVITAEQPRPTAEQAEAFQLIMLELGLLTLLILALVGAIYLLRRQSAASSGGQQVEPGAEPGTYLMRQSDGTRTVLMEREQGERARSSNQPSP